MKLGEAIKKAVAERNGAKAGSIADQLRSRFGMNYEAVYNWAHKLTGVSLCDWEDFMYQADVESSWPRPMFGGRGRRVP